MNRKEYQFGKYKWLLVPHIPYLIQGSYNYGQYKVNVYDGDTPIPLTKHWANQPIRIES